MSDKDKPHVLVIIAVLFGESVSVTTQEFSNLDNAERAAHALKRSNGTRVSLTTSISLK
ncbi:hypothetical protein D3C79_655430 [compost metagenome]